MIPSVVTQSYEDTPIFSKSPNLAHRLPSCDRRVLDDRVLSSWDWLRSTNPEFSDPLDNARTIRLSSPLGARQRRCLLRVDKPLKAEPVRIRLRNPHPSKLTGVPTMNPITRHTAIAMILTLISATTTLQAQEPSGGPLGRLVSRIRQHRNATIAYAPAVAMPAPTAAPAAGCDCR